MCISNVNCLLFFSKKWIPKCRRKKHRKRTISSMSSIQRRWKNCFRNEWASRTILDGIESCCLGKSPNCKSFVAKRTWSSVFSNVSKASRCSNQFLWFKFNIDLLSTDPLVKLMISALKSRGWWACIWFANARSLINRFVLFEATSICEETFRANTVDEVWPADLTSNEIKLWSVTIESVSLESCKESFRTNFFICLILVELKLILKMKSMLLAQKYLKTKNKSQFQV